VVSGLLVSVSTYRLLKAEREIGALNNKLKDLLLKQARLLQERIDELETQLEQQRLGVKRFSRSTIRCESDPPGTMEIVVGGKVAGPDVVEAQ
jgi:hypothetical protein